MAGRGRGRGRGAMVFSREMQPGERVDMADKVDKDPMSKLIALIRSLSLTPSDKELVPVRDVACQTATSSERLQEIVELVYHRCQDDWHFSRCAGAVANSLASLEVGSTKFRTLLLGSVNRDFKVKDKLRQESPQRCLACIALIVEIFCQMKTAGGEVFLTLVTPVIDGLQMFLDNKASDEEMECAATKLLVAGKLLQNTAGSDKLNPLRNAVREKIISCQGSKEVRLKLIEVLEAFASNFKVDLEEAS